VYKDVGYIVDFAANR